MPDMKSNDVPLTGVSVFVRSDLTLMVCIGDKALEVMLEPGAARSLGEALFRAAIEHGLEPTDAIETAHALLGEGLAAARMKAAARSGALQAIELAARAEHPSEEPNGTQTPPLAH